MHPTKIDLPESSRTKLVDSLNARLADAVDMKLQSKQAHWNVKGPSFIALHELFDKVAADTEAVTDLIAERVTILGGTADGTAGTVSGKSNLPRYPVDIVDGRAHVDALSSSLAAFGKLIRDAIKKSEDLGDMDTADLFTEVSRGADKNLWFVEAHMQADR